MKETYSQCMAERGRETGRMELCLKMDKGLETQRITEVLQRPAFKETRANIITGLKQGQHYNNYHRTDP